jgi:hypothetical protein
MSERPRKENIDFFENVLRGHSAVMSFEKIDARRYIVRRSTGRDLVVFVTNEYIIGEQFFYETRSKFADVDTIVTISAWNSYTKSVKNLAAADHIGIFVAREFVGVLNWKEPWKYIKKDDEGNPVRFWRERDGD